MTGPEHFKEAERLLDGPNVDAYDDMEVWRRDRVDNLAEAQVHATLALAAAQERAAMETHRMAEHTYRMAEHARGVKP